MLVCVYANEFLLRGGDVTWLTGLCDRSKLSAKLRNLSELNDLLAHCPWRVTKYHIAKLTSTQNARWSMAELIQAVIILVHVHCLSSLLPGCQLLPGAGGRSSMTSSSQVITWTQARDSSSSDEKNSTISYNQHVPVTAELRDQPFNYSEWLEKFVSDPDVSYPDVWQGCCKTVSGEPSVAGQRLNPHYFSWEVDGYSLANISYVPFGDLIDTELRSVRKLFHNSTSGQSPDRSSSRIETVSTSATDSDRYQAVWQYVHHILGVRYEDYSYRNIQRLLPEKLRSYIKLIVCCPERIGDELFTDIVSSVQRNDKQTAINVVAMEARLQVELMYCLNAVNDYQTMPSS